MDAKTKQQLEEAKLYFYAWKLNEAYGLLRRFFDRLPFRPQKEHAQYVGMFARVLVELGKDFELKFYLSELERLYDKIKDPGVAYPLAVIYTYLPEPKNDLALTLFEEIVKDPKATDYHAKAKMMLAVIYDMRGDSLACRLLIDSIVPDPDPFVAILVEIWKAEVSRKEKKLDLACNHLKEILAGLSPSTNWYGYFSACLILTKVYIDQGAIESAKQTVDQLRKLFIGRAFKSVQAQLSWLEDEIKRSGALGAITWTLGEKDNICTYGHRSVSLKAKTSCDRLMSLLVKKRFVPKESIVRNLYERQYVAEQDDKLIYYHIHALRKRLKSIGLPANAITFESDGYRLVPEVEIVEENP